MIYNLIYTTAALQCLVRYHHEGNTEEEYNDYVVFKFK